MLAEQGDNHHCCTVYAVPIIPIPGISDLSIERMNPTKYSLSVYLHGAAADVRPVTRSLYAGPHPPRSLSPRGLLPLRP